MQPSKADEAAGLSPGNEDNTAGRHFSPEKPCGPLYTEGNNRRCNTYGIYIDLVHVIARSRDKVKYENRNRTLEHLPAPGGCLV